MRTHDNMPVHRTLNKLCTGCEHSAEFNDGTLHFYTCDIGVTPQHGCPKSPHEIMLRLREAQRVADAAAEAAAVASFKKSPLTPIEDRLVNVLTKDGPLDRDQLVTKLDAPRTTVFDGLAKLIRRGMAKKYPIYETVRSRGRPHVLFSLIS